MHELVYKNRSYRKFKADSPITTDLLTRLVDLARCTPSARNRQPLKYKIVNTPKNCSEVFRTLAWAGYLADGAPKPGEEPSAYIIVCQDNTIAETSLWDQGIVAQTMLLGAVEQGLGGCIIASIKRIELTQALHLPMHLTPVLALALGYPTEIVQITDVRENDIKYYRDAAGIHYVPKRSLNEILLK